jgi:hypothetical protein
MCQTEEGLYWPRALSVDEEDDPLLVAALLLKGEMEL